MRNSAKFGALALASLVALAPALTSPASAAAACKQKATVTMLGTIKPEIQDQFLAAVADYNKSQKCYTVKSIPGDKNLTFLQNVTPMYAAKHAPTIMYTLQEIPDMANKVMDWKGTKLLSLVPAALRTAGNVNGKQVGVPSTVEAFGLLYNKSVLDKAGVDPNKIKTRDQLEAAFKKVQASGTGAMHFSSIWWSLGAHFSNEYFTHTAKTHEARLKVLDQMSDGTRNLMSDPVFQDYIATFDLLKKYADAAPNTTDTEYDMAVADLATGKAGFWFMGNWAEPNLLQASPNTNFGIMPLPISNNPKAYGNDSISVGVPGYFMIDAKQSTPAQRAGAVDFLTWLFTSAKGQHHVVDPAGQNGAGGMGFIPVYAGTKVKPATYMSKLIAKYVAAGKSLEWMNTYYPAGGQNLYGASGQKYMAGAIDAAGYAGELQAAWKGVPKTWRGVKVTQ